MLGALDQVLPAGGHGFMDDLRIGEGKVGRAHRIDELAHDEDQPVPLLLIETLDILYRLEPGCCTEQILSCRLFMSL